MSEENFFIFRDIFDCKQEKNLDLEMYSQLLENYRSILFEF